MKLKEITAHIRNRIKIAGIDAKVSMQAGSVRVSVPAYDFFWTDEQRHQILTIAQVNHMTMVRGLPIEPDRQCVLSSAGQSLFFYPAA